MFCRTRLCRRMCFRLTFACCIALMYIQIQLLPASKRMNLVRTLTLRYEKSPPKDVAWDELCKINDSFWEKSEFPCENSTKRLNILKWNDIKGYTINSLVRQPLFPWQPSEMTYTSLTLVKQNSLHYGQWIIGYLHVDLTGEYLFALSSDDSSEFSISTDENPANAQRVAFVTGWTRLGQHNKYFYQISDPVPLKKCKKYFMEIVHKQSQGEGFVSLSWKRPGHEKFFVITSSFLSPLVTGLPVGANPYEVIISKEQKKLKEVLENQRKNKISKDKRLSSLLSMKRLFRNKTTSQHISCRFGLYKDRARWHGKSYIAVYPSPLDSSHQESNQEKEEIYELPKKTAKDIIAKYLELSANIYQGMYSFGYVVSVERKTFSTVNERYLVDFVLRGHQEDVRVTDYLLRKWADDSICTLDELQWNSSTFIHIILIVDDGEWNWAWQLMDNIEDIANRTNDKALHLTIVDYDNDDNLKAVLRTRSTFANNINVISKSGSVNQAASILDAMKSQQKNEKIVMLLDPHLKMPLDIMDQVRKHCVESYMAFSPLAFNLEEGYSPAEPEGLWDTTGLKLIAMFQKDWQRYLATKIYQNELDLENSVLMEIDVARLRIENLYYFSSN